ncbi:MULTISPECIES: hypothetical protein [unclassified Curtobacterium]|uniref:hypothetical protein n=1 Tax=unclassified Curtobacterium TaxID=257496 RepID=UPI0008DD017E|nr:MULTISPECIES: hypothetical protein [unclassified Curtobacterium]OIH93139.1 hypothetical protein BIU92_09805 [Curtobacterium sp. MCBA15_003]OII10624.1 hypothetical protein BIU97_11000 [Curtobacterium sp. MCBA15_009]OII30050.1 hypothetical protein BIU94_10540 [Curtobacterium sp. MMLR14_006]
MGTGTGVLAAWPPAAVALVVAAFCTATLTMLVAVVGGVWAVVRWRQDVAREQRDRYWSRLTVVFDLVTATEVGRREIGRNLAQAMYDMQKVPAGEEPAARVLAELLIERRRQ